MNAESNLFNPTNIEMSRSTFEYHPTVSGTCLAGRLIPVKAIEVLPGDSIKMDLRTLVKMSTPVYPTMDQLFMDVSFFFVPNKLILSSRYGTPDLNESNRSWAAFIGAQDNLTNMPLPADGITLPRLWVDDEIYPGTLCDYFCYPQNVSGLIGKINAIEVMAYFAIWNENYREPNTMDPIVWNYSPGGDGLFYFFPNNSPKLYLWGAEEQGNKIHGQWAYALGGDDEDFTIADKWLPLPVSRFHGYFGSALPWPQRNLTGVELPLGESAPVYTTEDANPNSTEYPWKALLMGALNGSTPQYADGNLEIDQNGSLATDGQGSGSLGSQPLGVVPTNLIADLSSATAANINALRAAIQKQRWYEHLARSGNRLDELEFGLFGVRPHDSGDDRPQYLGGKRIPLNIEMVASTNGGNSVGAAEGAGSLGRLGAFSHTNDTDHYFYHSFDTWGTLMCVMTIRHHDTFCGNLDRKLTRKTRDDFYWPTFAHLGEQAILNRELHYTDDDNADKVFGYQEAWAEYRHDFDKVCGLLTPVQSLGFMTYADSWRGENAPTLAEFLNASPQAATIDKTLAVSANDSGFQFIYQFTFDYTARRCMPTYSDPGLIDHF